MASASNSFAAFSPASRAAATQGLSEGGRPLWSLMDEDEEPEELAAMNVQELVAHPGTMTPSNGISSTTFRTTPVSVRALDNMGHKIFMVHAHDTMARLRLLIFSKFGIPSACQKLLFRGAVLGDDHDSSLFSPHLLGERLVYVSDLRVLEVRVVMPGGFADLQLKISPTLLVSTLRSRIFAATGIDPSFFRLSLGIYALMDELCLQAYGVVGGRVDVLMHVRVRGGRVPILPYMPPRTVEVDIETDDTFLPDDVWAPHLLEDPIDQFTTDDESGEEESDLLSVGESETDSTASANSLPGFSGEENCLFDHGRLRLNNLMASMTAPGERPSSEQVAHHSPPSASTVIASDGDAGLLAPSPKRQRAEDPEDTGFQIFVKALSGTTLVLWVERVDTIETVKRLILFTLRWVFSQPRDLILVFNTIRLEDAHTVAQCGITSGAQIIMIVRLRGGMERSDESDDNSMPDTPGGAASAGPPAALTVPPAVAETEALKTMTKRGLETPQNPNF